MTPEEALMEYRDAKRDAEDAKIIELRIAEHKEHLRYIDNLMKALDGAAITNGPEDY